MLHNILSSTVVIRDIMFMVFSVTYNICEGPKLDA